VGSPRRKAGWNFWNYPSPEGVIGIDAFGSTIDTALQKGLFQKSGNWYVHPEFPGGKLNGGAQVKSFLRENPDLAEAIRRDLVMREFNKVGNIMEAKETLADVAS
jgi:hypothetical protein